MPLDMVIPVIYLCCLSPPSWNWILDYARSNSSMDWPLIQGYVNGFHPFSTHETRDIHVSTGLNMCLHDSRGFWLSRHIDTLIREITSVTFWRAFILENYFQEVKISLYKVWFLAIRTYNVHPMHAIPWGLPSVAAVHRTTRS